VGALWLASRTGCLSGRNLTSEILHRFDAINVWKQGNHATTRGLATDVGARVIGSVFSRVVLIW
jgi:hypothetical protein